MSTDGEKPAGSAAEVFAKILDVVGAQFAPERMDAMGFPDDELHREILLPLLPAMLGDATIRANWQEQTASGFFARLAAYLNETAPRPRWTPADFEIHVTASYLAGPDAKALADTLLSEESLRELTAALMNQAAEKTWDELAAPTEPVLETTQAPEQETIRPSAEPEVLEPAVAEAGPTEEPERTERTERPEPADAEAEISAAEVPAALVAKVPALDEVELLPAEPAIRPKLPNFRRNPLAGGAHFRRIAFPTWTKGNPLSRRPATWSLGPSPRES